MLVVSPKTERNTFGDRVSSIPFLAQSENW